MVKRLVDFVLSVCCLLILLPVFLLVSAIIKLSDKGPIFYFAHRAGLNGRPFKLIKFRTMVVGADKDGKITGLSDNRVFRFGELLRKTKLDELPQMINVIKGEMSIVGPRPESIDIVEQYYDQKFYRLTLSVRPGIASPGSIFNYTHSQKYLDEDNIESSYVQKLLPVKLALELVYINNQSMIYDFRLILRTLKTIIEISFGKTSFKLPPEYYVAVKQGLIIERLK
jgi:lipopolysaccharide/colanic/teichoic acid biosynthesis glycosyltransferase